MIRGYVTLALLALFFAGCSRASGPTQVQLDSSVNGRTISAIPGDALSLQLNLNADGGYQWNYQISDSTIVTTGSPPTFEVPENGVGGITVETFHFRVLREGRCTMTFEELRGWEQGVAPISTVEFLVVANP